jgi:hypothetical protein
LRGHQSVRTTFRLPVDLIELLGIVAAQFGIKQKTLFDQLVEDIDLLYRLAETVAEPWSEGAERRQKTYVLSKQSLLALERVAAARRIPRDTLVEVSIERLLPLILAEQEKQQNREKLFTQLKELQVDARSLRERAEKELGDGDQVTEILQRMVRSVAETETALSQVVARGRQMARVRIGRLKERYGQCEVER